MSIKVLIVDDSAVVRQVLSEMIGSAAGMEVMDTAADPLFALDKLKKHKPDVIMLDVEMPRMDGLTFLKKIMQENPLPVVMCSTLTEKSSRTSLKALELGAVEVVAKPKVNLKSSLQDSKKLIIDSIRAAARANISILNKGCQLKATHSLKALNVPAKQTADAVLSRKAVNRAATITSNRFVAIGTSTGGTQALEFVLSKLNLDAPGIVVVQHMPAAFTAAFAERLDSICKVHVKEAVNGDLIMQGQVLIAPGGKHMLVKNNGGEMTVQIKDGPLVSRHRPSVDVLFRSVAQSAPKAALGIIMTGMGDDGANGLKEMKDNGSYTLAQDKESCVIFGMPAVAIQKGAVNTVVPLDKIATMICAFSGVGSFKNAISD
jgi:two-component system chemotaxis response regulator CheB